MVLDTSSAPVTFLQTLRNHLMDHEETNTTRADETVGEHCLLPRNDAVAGGLAGIVQEQQENEETNEHGLLSGFAGRGAVTSTEETIDYPPHDDNENFLLLAQRDTDTTNITTRRKIECISDNQAEEDADLSLLQRPSKASKIEKDNEFF